MKKPDMEKSKYFVNGLIVSVILFSFVPDIYSESPYRKLFYSTYINREMSKWGSIIHTIEATKEPTNLEQKLEYIDYYYGYIGHLIEKKQFDAAQLELPHGQKLINEVIRISPQNATAYSYKGAFVGFRISISKLKLIYLWSNNNTNQNWKYINLLTILAITYDKIDMPEESKLTYEKILRKEPNYKLVRDELYPKLLSRLKILSQNN